MKIKNEMIFGYVIKSIALFTTWLFILAYFKNSQINEDLPESTIPIVVTKRAVAMYLYFQKGTKFINCYGFNFNKRYLYQRYF